MQKSLLIALLLVAAFASACDSPEKRIRRLVKQEAALEAAAPGTPAAADTTLPAALIEAYEAFVQKYPAHESAPEYLYKAAMVQADRRQNFTACIALLERIRREYPQHRRAENALFLIGYTYAEQLKEFDRAKTYYEAFLQQYPGSEMKTSVEFELANLGKPVEELEIFKTLSK